MSIHGAMTTRAKFSSGEMNTAGRFNATRKKCDAGGDIRLLDPFEFLAVEIEA